MRVDKWLWHARFMRSRSKASKFCQSNNLRVNGNIVYKAHYLVKPNDVLTFTMGNNIRVIKILNIGFRRGPASEAEELYDDISPPITSNKKNLEYVPIIGKRETGSGRPTKGERRAIDKLMSKGENW